jgi:uncharacterized protein
MVKSLTRFDEKDSSRTILHKRVNLDCGSQKLPSDIFEFTNRATRIRGGRSDSICGSVSQHRRNFMLLEGSHFIHSSPDRVFALILDPDVLSRCVPGVKSLILDGPDSYSALVEVAIGPVKGKFDGKIAITEKVAPQSMTLKVQFKSSVGIANAVGTLKLEAETDGTRVHWAGEPQLMGMIASVGARLIGGVAKTQADLFFSKLEHEAQAPAPQ